LSLATSHCQLNIFFWNKLTNLPKLNCQLLMIMHAKFSTIFILLYNYYNYNITFIIFLCQWLQNVYAFYIICSWDIVFYNFQWTSSFERGWLVNWIVNIIRQETVSLSCMWNSANFVSSFIIIIITFLTFFYQFLQSINL
jgi:hypothetical protein